MSAEITPEQTSVAVGPTEVYEIGDLDGLGDKIVVKFEPGIVTFCDWHESIPGLTKCDRCAISGACPIPEGVLEGIYPKYH
jgi:hypothetical protein